MKDEPEESRESGDGSRDLPNLGSSLPSPDSPIPTPSPVVSHPSPHHQREPIAHAAISVILWSHNSESELTVLLDEWHRCLSELAPIHEIIFVDDCSTDQTLRVAHEWALAHPNARVFGVRDEGREPGEELNSLPAATSPSSFLLPPSSPSAGGAGACLRVGLAAAQYPLVAYCELRETIGGTKDELRESGHYRDRSRGAYCPEDLKQMLEIIDEVDIVCGFRTRKGRVPMIERLYRWVVRLILRLKDDCRHIRVLMTERLYRWLARMIFGVRLKDAYCPFKLFRRHIFKRIPIQSNGDFAHAEILAKANFLGCLMTEVPVELRDELKGRRDETTSSPGRHLSSSFIPHRSSIQLAEALQVFRHPDFGPPTVSEEKYQSILPKSENPPQTAEPSAQETKEGMKEEG
jgi:glycosyltransferase involved in cell wall biosynthesis